MIYVPPWYLRDGLVQTYMISQRFGNSYAKLQDETPWLRPYPCVPWQEQVFTGADGVPLWGLWHAPVGARGTLLITYGITGKVGTAWYAQVLARKAYARGWAVVLYDWRAHGRTAQLSAAPSSDGWREGEDQVRMAEQLVALGCPPKVVLAGFSLGGQLALWGLKTAHELQSSHICGATVQCPNLQSNRSLQFLRTTWTGRQIEAVLVKELQQEARLRASRYPQFVKPGAVERIHLISDFDHEMVIDYYGFASVEAYYQRTSMLHHLDALALPYQLIYAADDPMFDPALIPEIELHTAQNPQAELVLTAQGGHVAHIALPTAQEDQFWALNRMLDYADRLV